MSVDIQPATRCYPREDPEFAFDISNAVDDIGSYPAEVEASLHEKYPMIRIVVRDALANVAGPDEDEVVWYCYRDGSALTR